MHQLQFFRASGRLPRRFFWIGVLLLLILLSCAVFVSVLLAGVARSATGSETVSFAVFAVLGGLSILAGLYSLTCLMSQRLRRGIDDPPLRGPRLLRHPAKRPGTQYLW